jgi:folate-binding protein YgfZ
MDADWREALLVRGARLDGDAVVSFGAPDAEARAVETGTVVCDLSHLGVIRFEGGDAETFLQGQVTCDVREIRQGAVRYGGYNTPQGRLIATFLIWHADGAFHIQLPAAMREAVAKRLQMFVLRSKVRISDATCDAVRIGLGGPCAAALAAAAGVPSAGHRAHAGADGALWLPLAGNRWEMVVPPAGAAAVWDALAAAGAAPAGADWWDWTEVRAGVPVVVPDTRDQFVPQMANLDLIGGVSFDKGCYTGQEIVARTQYLGRLKRRMYLAHVDIAADTDAPPRPGDPAFDDRIPGQACGMLSGAAPAPGGGFDVLVVMQTASRDSPAVRWKSVDGPALRFLPMPYAVPVPHPSPVRQ